MATVTPNFNFPVPQSTDLVKDGATAIAALGTAIDTDFVDLKGGTTGQVLSKASGTDLDFTWIAQDDSNAIQNAIVDAKGDLIAASAADTPARLAVGNNGESLVADSSTATGLRYQGTMAAGKNAIINGGMDIWQRGTSSAISTSIGGSWGGDRFLAYRSVSGGTVSQNASTGLDGFKNAMRMQRNSGNTSTSGLTAIQNVESSMAIPYAGKTVTLSFWARKGADFSATSSAIAVYLWTGTGTDQAWYAYTGQATAISTNATLTTSWQRFSFTATLGSTVTEFATEFLFNPTGTAGTNDWWEFTGVQLEVGSVATNFTRAGGTIQGELAACRRYLPAINIAATGSATFLGYAYTTNSAIIPISFDVPARVGPTGITTPTVNTTNFTVRNKSNGDATITSLSFDISGVNGATLLAGATLTTGDVCRLVVNNTSYILFTGCEL